MAVQIQTNIYIFLITQLPKLCENACTFGAPFHTGFFSSRLY